MMSEFYCECGRAWMYAFHNIGCPDCGAKKPYRMGAPWRKNGKTQLQADVILALFDDPLPRWALWRRWKQANRHRLLRALRAEGPLTLCGYEAQQMEFVAATLRPWLEQINGMNRRQIAAQDAGKEQMGEVTHLVSLGPPPSSVTTTDSDLPDGHYIVMGYDIGEDRSDHAK
jgi:hypothetical protein